MAWCRGCRQPRSLDELVRVEAVHGGEVFFTCKPDSASGAWCFRRAVGPATVHRIASTLEKPDD